MKTKAFTLRTLLTITTGRMLAAGGIGDVYQILNWMTDDNLFTHQLPRACDQCRPWLLKWFPELAPCGVGLNKLNEWISKSMDGPETGVVMWVTEQKMMFPELRDGYEIPQIPAGEYEAKNPMQELSEMMPNKPIIAVQL